MNCPCCLKENVETYCDKCRKKLFDERKINHILSFSRPEFNEIKRERSGKLSISGIQVKHSLKFEGNELILTEKGGEYILKPIPSGQFKNLNAVPANEHLTMQIAAQIFGVPTAENAVIFFSDMEMAYITKRFDLLADGKKLLQEDFAQLAQLTEETGGKNYKYDYSYEQIAELMKNYIGAYSIEVEKYFKVILFNFLCCNGDAHIKNFSIYRNEKYGDYLLTPFYDLLNTSIHIPNEQDTALELFKDGFMTEGYKFSSKYSKDDFYEFGERIGIKPSRIFKIFDEITSGEKEINELADKSYLEDSLKSEYLKLLNERRERLQYSYSADKRK
jgi:serine/threonine-protein kinase HipA